MGCILIRVKQKLAFAAILLSIRQLRSNNKEWLVRNKNSVSEYIVTCLPTGARSYIFTSPGICKKRREDTFFAAQSESRILAPFFASKTV